MQTAYRAARLPLKQTTRSRRELADDNDYVVRAQGFREITKGEKGHLTQGFPRSALPRAERVQGGWQATKQSGDKSAPPCGHCSPHGGRTFKARLDPAAWRPM
ncbi:hypothetical protein MTO96_030904 [Rhipicephalus appendiculatus]